MIRQNIIGILALIIIISGAIVIVSNAPKVANLLENSTKTYSLTEVAVHKNRESCWTTISGGVYDLTPWINEHPGGAEAILSLCGIDGTTPFLTQHGGQAQPEQELKTLFIGKLK